MQSLVVGILVGLALLNLGLGCLGQRGRLRLAARLDPLGSRLPGASWLARRLRWGGEGSPCSVGCERCAFWRPEGDCRGISSPRAAGPAPPGPAGGRVIPFVPRRRS